MRLLLPCLAALLLVAPAVAPADTLDTFTLTTQTNTYTFSLPALIPDYYPPNYPPPGPHVGIDNYITTAQGSTDGVPGSTFGLDFITQDGAQFRLGLIFSPSVSSPDYYRLSGPILVEGPLTDFPTGTFYYTDAFPSGNPDQLFGGPYTLTITPQSTPTPEPSTLSLLLFGTAACGLLWHYRQAPSRTRSSASV